MFVFQSIKTSWSLCSLSKPCCSVWTNIDICPMFSIVFILAYFYKHQALSWSRQTFKYYTIYSKLLETDVQKLKRFFPEILFRSFCTFNKIVACVYQRKRWWYLDYWCFRHLFTSKSSNIGFRVLKLLIIWMRLG